MTEKEYIEGLVDRYSCSLNGIQNDPVVPKRQARAAITEALKAQREACANVWAINTMGQASNHSDMYNTILTAQIEGEG